MTKPFDVNDRAAILAALEDTDPGNPVVAAIEQRLHALAKILEEACTYTGELPGQIQVSKPATALDEIVIDLFKASLLHQRHLVARLRGIPPEELGIPEIRILDHGRQ